MTSSQIGDWFIKEEGTNGEALIPYLNVTSEFKLVLMKKKIF